MDATSEPVGIVVLAAGAARRMGAPKQLLSFGGKTLLRRQVETAVAAASDGAPIVVVLGANFELLKEEIEDLPVCICFNAEWENGLSSSVKSGLEKLLAAEPQVAAALLTLADQPLITSAHLDQFVAAFRRSKKDLIAAAYGDDALGVPALFAKRRFGELCAELAGDQGAGAFLRRRRAEILKISVPEAAFDVDTPRDWQRLSAPKNSSI